jgi:hypothetical protein
VGKYGRVLVAFALSSVLLVFTLVLVLFASQRAAKGEDRALPPSQAGADQQVVILVDDYATQPMQGHTFWFHNRLGGDRGPIGRPESVVWRDGVVTATIVGMETLVGAWTSLNHPIYDCAPINFSAIFPPQIKPEYQGHITGLRIRILDGRGTFYVELKIGENTYCPPHYAKWTSAHVNLSGGPRDLSFDLPSNLGQIQTLNWVLTGTEGDYVVVDRVELTATVPYPDTSGRAFLWSYAMLLANWDPGSGLTRDHAYYAANQFDNVSASGVQAAAAAMAWRLGFISQDSATEIVSKTTQALLDLPRDGDDCGRSGLWPHFVDHGHIVTGTEWSSIDTVIAAVALIEAREALGLGTTEVEQVLEDVRWNTLTLTDGHISHGYWFTTPCQIIEPGGEGGWRDFGTESWLVNLGYAAATGKVAEFDHTPPTFNGGGFIDELAWLLMPPCCGDRWGTEWCSYSQRAADCQLAYYRCQEAEAAGCCRGDHQCQDPDAGEGCSCCRDHPCYGPPGLFGLTPVEVPDLSALSPADKRTYREFGVCGEHSCMDGTDSWGHAVIVPHYAGVIASLRPTRAISLWNWIETKGLFTPLNNPESLMFVDEPACGQIVWNARKGSWELGLQTLGWGRLLVGDNHPLYQAMWSNNVLRQGYLVMRYAHRVFLPTVMKQ